MEFTGDNFLAEFPSAADAVRCAIEVQRVLEALNADLPEDRRMRFRMGVSLGDITQEGDQLFGTGVNVAARLEPMAEAEASGARLLLRTEVEAIERLGGGWRVSARTAQGDSESVDAVALVNAAGLEFDEASAHSAAYDAEITADIFCEIVNRFRPTFEASL